MVSFPLARIKLPAAWLACLVLTACLPAHKPVITGVLHGELTWRGEVILGGDVILAEDAKLTIVPGTRVRFLPPDAGPGGLVEHPHFPGSELIVKGHLQAVGSAALPIVFEAAAPGAAAGSWGSVNLEASRRAVFKYCIFRQADSAIHSRDSRVLIEQSLFENNLVGVRFHDSEIRIEHNLLRNNHTAIRFHFGAPLIRYNEFSGNDVNLFITSHPRDYLVADNVFGTPGEYHVVLGEMVPEDVLVPGNFWAHADAATGTPAFYDGRRSPYLGQVLTDPPSVSPSALAGLSWSP